MRPLHKQPPTAAPGLNARQKTPHHGIPLGFRFDPASIAATSSGISPKRSPTRVLPRMETWSTSNRVAGDPVATVDSEASRNDRNAAARLASAYPTRVGSGWPRGAAKEK